MYVHWQQRYENVIIELDRKQSAELVADLTTLTADLGYSTKVLEILLANVKEVLPDVRSQE